MSYKFALKIICPTHGRDPIPEKCQEIRQYYHSNCGGYSSICVDDGNLHCSRCTFVSHISNFEFFCRAEDKYKQFSWLQGDVVKNLFNQAVGYIDDDEEQDEARKIFRKIWMK